LNDIEADLNDAFYVSLDSWITFNGIQIVKYEDYSFQIFMTSRNFNSYFLTVNINETYSILNVDITAGFVGYDGYSYQGVFRITQNYLILSATQYGNTDIPYLVSQTYLFVFDLVQNNTVPYLGYTANYPMYDTISRILISGSTSYSSPIFVEAIDVGSDTLLLTSNGVFANSPGVYAIYTNWSLVTYGTIFESSQVTLQASNDLFTWNRTITLTYPVEYSSHVVVIILLAMLCATIGIFLMYFLYSRIMKWRMQDNIFAPAPTTSELNNATSSTELGQSGYRAIQD